MFGKIILKKTIPAFTTRIFAQRMLFSTQSNSSLNKDLLEEIETDLFALLKSKEKCQIEKLSRTATFEELGFDSLDSVELVVEMEEVMKVDIENDEAEKIKSVHDAIMTFYNHKLGAIDKK